MKPVSKKFFSDYEVAEGTDGNGRVLVYIGNTYTADMPKARYIKRRRIFAAMMLLCVVLFAAAGLLPVESNMKGPMASFNILVVLPLFLGCYGAIAGMFKKITLTRGDFLESSMFLKFGAFLAGLLAFVEGIWHIFFIIGGSAGDFAGELWVAVLWLIIGSLEAAVWAMELSTKYIVRNRYGSIIHQDHFKKRESINNE